MTDFAVHSQAPMPNNSIGGSGDAEKRELLRLFYEAIDATTAAIKERFDQDDLTVLKKIQECIISSANGEYDVTEIKQELEHISQIVNLGVLAHEVRELPLYIKLYNQETTIPLKRVTKVTSICDVLNQKPSSKACLPEVHKLLKFYNTIALGSATAERSFSVMRRIKSWLRSTMSANSLNNRMFATIHKKRMDNLCIEDIAVQFINQTDTRQKYFGHF